MLRSLCDDGRMTVETDRHLRRWSMLVIALTATLCANVFINGAAFLIPTLHTERGLDLAKAGLLSSMPSFGMVVTLIAWGYVVDRIGERIVLALGSALTAAAAFAAASVHSLVAVGAFLLLGGMAAASSNTASGRLVVGWFPPQQRGLVMGIRQTAQPLGVGLGALVIPRWRRATASRSALLFPAVVCAVVGRRVRGGGEGSAATAARGGRRARPRQPVPRLGDAVAHPRRVGASGRAAGRGVDLHAGVADGRARLVGGIGRRAGDAGPGARRRRPDRGGPVVGHRGLAAAADPRHRAGGRRFDGPVGADRLARTRRSASRW